MSTTKNQYSTESATSAKWRFSTDPRRKSAANTRVSPKSITSNVVCRPIVNHTVEP